MKQTYACMATQANNYPVTLRCPVLGVARSGSYDGKRRAARIHAKQDATLTSQIQTIFGERRQTDGSPRGHAARHAQGVTWSKKRGTRVMRSSARVARRKRRRVRTTASRHSEPLAPNALARNVQPTTLNHVWVGAST